MFEFLSHVFQSPTMRIIKIIFVSLLATPVWAFAQPVSAVKNIHEFKDSTFKHSVKMQVEIWSDVVCPFCYIGKRKFEEALDKFPQKDKIEVVWKSYQLDPEATVEGADYRKNLSERKGWSPEQTREITENVTKMAADVGLEYNFEKAVAANSFDAHRFSQLALARGLQDAAEEALFKAHFTEGKNIADRAMLTALGASIGLDPIEVKNTLESQAYADEVHLDIEQARQFRVSGVPFFVFDRKYAVSGAQDSGVFLKTLEKALETWDGTKQ